MMFRRSFFFTFLALSLLGGSFCAGYFFRDHFVTWEDNLPLLGRVISLLKQHGLKELPPAQELEYGMVRGLLQVYDDPYTVFVEPTQHELETNTLEGSFGGIGVRISRDNTGNVILYPYPDGPASEAGVTDGDNLKSIDRLQIEITTTTDEIQAAIRGPVGKAIGIGILRPSTGETLEFSIRRAEIALPSVTWHIDTDHAEMGIVDVNVFATTTAEEVEKGFKDLESRGARVFILDLRDNFGGLLTAGVDVARLFLAKGVVIQEQFRNQEIATYRIEKPGTLMDVPLAVLVNQHTASAAEIIAGTFKAHGRAQLIGVPTFGKATIQMIFDLQDGSSLHITAARWWVPDLEPAIAENGVQPDIYLESSPDPNGRDALVREAARLLLGDE